MSIALNARDMHAYARVDNTHDFKVHKARRRKTCVGMCIDMCADIRTGMHVHAFSGHGMRVYRGAQSCVQACARICV